MIAGAEARKVFDEAQRMLQCMINNESLTANGVVGFYSANSVGDDILLYDDDTMPRGKPKATLFGLRQQTEIDSQTHYRCISDFVAPVDSGLSDYVGMFAVSTGFGAEELCKK